MCPKNVEIEIVGKYGINGENAESETSESSSSGSSSDDEEDEEETTIQDTIQQWEQLNLRATTNEERMDSIESFGRLVEHIRRMSRVAIRVLIRRRVAQFARRRMHLVSQST